MRANDFVTEYKARGKVSGKGPISIGNLYKDDMPVINTPISKYLEVRVDNKKEEYPEYFFYDKATGECVGNFALNTWSDSTNDAKDIVKPGVLIVEPHITLAPALQGKGIGTIIYRTFLADDNRVFATYGHSAAAGSLWNKVASGSIISVLYDPTTGQVVDAGSKESRRAVRLLGHKSKFNLSSKK